MADILNDPLVTDLMQMIRVKLAANSTVTAILGTAPLRVYRNHPPKDKVYPIIVMTRVGRDDETDRNTSVDFFINLAIFSISHDHTSEDVLEREILTTFGNPETNYSQDDTKVEEVEVNGNGVQLWDDTHRTYNTNIELRIKARRKSHVMTGD